MELCTEMLVFQEISTLISSKILKSLLVLLALSFPGLVMSGTDWDCGDWTCSINPDNMKHEAAWVHSGEHRYQIYINEDKGACDNLSHQILTRNGENPLLEAKGQDVHFVFDDGSYIEVDVIFLDKDKIEFAPMNDTPKLENYLRGKSSLEIRSGAQILLGSYGLWGSNRAISLVSCK